MKKRTREILIEIIKSEEITISQLAESFDVSERTIRNDLNDINDFLQENDLSMVSIGNKKKIQHEEDIKEAMNLIGDKDFYSYKLSKDERKSMIAMLLIESSEYITLSKIADTLFVSRATIINDLGGVKEYLKREMKYDVETGGEFNVFAVEGATAAMCYIFDSLIANNLLLKGDKIAIMTPVFTPYLEIPHLPRYEFEVVYINADEIDENDEHTWQCSNKELEKLSNPDIKALFVVNPSNPPSVAISQKSISEIVDIVKTKNKDLMIISDDVYGTFIHGFRSLMADLPYNTIGVYSYSKYFGVTGWRLGTIALHENNVFDKLIKELPYSIRKRTMRRYADLNPVPENVPFIDRIVADSRQVSLNHTAGLSTPQQVQMAFFSAFTLIDKENNYKDKTINICKTRKKLLFDSLDIGINENENDASYYTQIDLLRLCKKRYGEEFVEYLKANYKPVDILFDLAQKSSIVLLGGGGFAGPEWSIRISLANLYDEAYSEIGVVLKRILDSYADDWKKLQG